jgi:hypothetical protein
MKYGVFIIALLAMFVMAPALSAQTCRLNAVEPDSGKAGDVVGVTGEQIDKTKVDELYLTDGKLDIKVEIVSQTDTAIKFKVPAKTKPGRYSLMLKTKGADAKLLEQPVKFTVDEG